MREDELKVIAETVQFDDKTLLKKFVKINNIFKELKQKFETSLENQNENDYLKVTVSRLQYEFAKEEFELLYNEVKKRRLTTYLYKEVV